ncbi:MAG: hypothetical protein QF682_10135 [Candidatus Thermoplasmatota archaeon]|nr:hypothetical protein [Candidatus Thermoplasmatota archaeon]
MMFLYCKYALDESTGLFPLLSSTLGVPSPHLVPPGSVLVDGGLLFLSRSLSSGGRS